MSYESHDRIYHNADGNAVAKTSSISGVETPIHILLGKLNCEGAENSVSQCSHGNSYECIRPGAGVICPVQLNGKLLASIGLILCTEHSLHV
jgi:hypothetical protein